jgi:ribosomal protein S18 acetylase RimI-like enzyme
MIRLATLEDARRIAEIQVASWQVAYRGILPDEYLEQINVEKREAVWRGCCGKEREVLWVGMRDDVVAGFCHVRASRDADADSASAEVTSIYLDPAKWRRGLGRELMAAARTSASELGFEQISLWVLVENMAARQFYEAVGFRSDGCLKQEEGPGFYFNKLRYVWAAGGNVANDLPRSHQELLDARRSKADSGESKILN